MQNALSRLQHEERTKQLLVLSLVFIILVTAFSLVPLPGGEDWEVFRGAAGRVTSGTPLYGVRDPTLYSNPPWVAVFLIPLSLLPLQLGYAVVIVSTFFLSLLVLQRWQENVGPIKPILLLLSPPMFYLVLHGQIDVLIISSILLPAEYWALFALAKPQTGIGLILGIDRSKYFRTVAIAGSVILVSFLLFGNWPSDFIAQNNPDFQNTHNVWLGLWPFQVPLGAFLLVRGWSARDERLLIAGSPFVAPYVALSSFIGPWIAGLSYLNNRQAVVVFLSWWGAVAFRLISP